MMFLSLLLACWLVRLLDVKTVPFAVRLIALNNIPIHYAVSIVNLRTAPNITQSARLVPIIKLMLIYDSLVLECFVIVLQFKLLMLVLLLLSSTRSARLINGTRLWQCV